MTMALRHAPDEHVWVKTHEAFGRRTLLVLRCECGDSVIRVPYPGPPLPRRND